MGVRRRQDRELRGDGVQFGAYAWPEQQRALAVTAISVLAAVNYRGVRATVRLTRAIVTIVLSALAAVVLGSLFGGTADPANLLPLFDVRALPGVLQAAGLLFFAFAGHARIATLGEEVVDPARTIPRAIPLALGITLAVYTAVAASALPAVGPEQLASASAPSLRRCRPGASPGSSPWSASAPPSPRWGCSSRSSPEWGARRSRWRPTESFRAGSLRCILASGCRTVPRSPLRRSSASSWRSVTSVAIGFSSFGVRCYYALTNASAWTLPPEKRRWSRRLAEAGLGGCVLLAFSLPRASVASGGAVLALGILAYGIVHALRSR